MLKQNRNNQTRNFVGLNHLCIQPFNIIMYINKPKTDKYTNISDSRQMYKTYTRVYKYKYNTMYYTNVTNYVITLIPGIDIY